MSVQSGSVRPEPRRAIAVFAKCPVPGRVKTRLVPPLESGEAAGLARAFLADTARLLARARAEQKTIYFAPDAGARDIAGIVGERFELTPQGGGDLGERLERAADREFERGCDALVILGADTPTLPLELVELAFAALAAADVVLGPAFDLGYYLVGLGRPAAAIFQGIRWGSEEVLPASLAAIRGAGLRLAVLPPFHDVDRIEDLRFLRAHIEALRLAGGEVPQATASFLDGLPERALADRPDAARKPPRAV